MLRGLRLILFEKPNAPCIAIRIEQLAFIITSALLHVRVVYIIFGSLRN